MPMRTLRFQGLNPYRNLQNRDPAVSGLATSGAALVNAPATRAAASKEAFNEEKKVQDGLFERSYKTGRAKADDKFKGQTLEQSKQRDASTNEYRGKQLEESANGRKQRATDNLEDRKLREKEIYNRAEGAFVDQVERGRHNRETEDKPIPPAKQKETALLAADLWAKSRPSAFRNELVNGRPTRVYDPVAHRDQYEQLRKLTKRDDLPEWQQIQDTADQIEKAGPAQSGAAPTSDAGDTAPTEDGGDEESATLFDDGADADAPAELFGDGRPPSQPVGRPYPRGAPSAPGEARQLTPMEAGRTGRMPRPASSSVQFNQAEVQAIKGLDPESAQQFQRILKSGDPDLIAKARQRLGPARAQVR